MSWEASVGSPTVHFARIFGVWCPIVWGLLVSVDQWASTWAVFLTVGTPTIVWGMLVSVQVRCLIAWGLLVSVDLRASTWSVFLAVGTTTIHFTCIFGVGCPLLGPFWCLLMHRPPFGLLTWPWS